MTDQNDNSQPVSLKAAVEARDKARAEAGPIGPAVRHDPQASPMQFFKDAKPLLMPDGSRPTTPAQEMDARLHRYDAEKLSGIGDPEKRTRTREAVRAAMTLAEEKRQARMEAFRTWNEAEKQWIDAQPQGSQQAAKREMARWKREQRHHGYLGKGIEQEIGTIEAIIQGATGGGDGRAERRKSFFSSGTKQQETNRSRNRDREHEQ